MKLRTKGGLAAMVFLISFGFSNAQAESVAAKNKRANDLFDNGEYQEAEKAYLAAEAAKPGQPEIQYNLGNARINQRKFDPGIETLKQAINAGNTTLQQNSWYNIGNALFEKKDFAGSIQSYIQALRLQPGDQDAKHNLELALKRMNEQTNSEGKPKQDSKQPEHPQNGQSAAGPDSRPEGQAKQPAAEQGGTLTKEQAVQILDALQNEELMEQRKVSKHPMARRGDGKDW